MDNQRPLVTFILLAYNQSAFVGRAVRAALEQEYGPMEIIISDDCSTDDTFELMKKAVEGYEGPHSIILNRNARNLNIGGHVAVASQLASGEILVMAAGDDISAPNRVSETVAAFNLGEDVYAAFSDVTEIDGDGEVVRAYVQKWIEGKPVTRVDLAKNGGGVATGASYAYRKECFSWPSVYPSSLMNEDRVLPFRAAMIGKVAYIPRPLVLYRLSAAGVSRALPAQQLMAAFKAPHIYELSRTLDAALEQGLTSASEAARLRRIVSELRVHAHLMLYFKSLDNPFGRLGLLLVDNVFNRDTLIRRALIKSGLEKLFGPSDRSPLV